MAVSNLTNQVNIEHIFNSELPFSREIRCVIFHLLTPKENTGNITVSKGWSSSAYQVAYAQICASIQQRVWSKVPSLFKLKGEKLEDYCYSFQLLKKGIDSQGNSIGINDLIRQSGSLTQKKHVNVERNVYFISQDVLNTIIQSQTKNLYEIPVSEWPESNPCRDRGGLKNKLTLQSTSNTLDRDKGIYEKIFIRFIAKNRTRYGNQISPWAHPHLQISYFPIELFALTIQGRQVTFEKVFPQEICIPFRGELTEFLIEGSVPADKLPTEVLEASDCCLGQFYVPNFDSTHGL